MVCEAIFAPRVSPELKSGKTFDDPLSTEEFRRVATPHAVTKSGEDVRAHRLKIPYFALQNALAFVDASLIVFPVWSVGVCTGSTIPAKSGVAAGCLAQA